MKEVSVQELARRREAKEDFAFIDIREPWEREICSLADSEHIPMRTLLENPASLPRDKDVLLICHHGVRTASVAAYLSRSGFSNIYSVAGGLAAWARDIDPSMSRY